MAVNEKNSKFEIVLSSFQTPNHVTYLSPFFSLFALWNLNGRQQQGPHTTLSTRGTTDGEAYYGLGWEHGGWR